MNRSKLLLALLAAAIAGAVGAGFVVSGSATAVTAVALPPSAASALQDTFVSVYKNVSPSVVQIQTSSGLGSGIVFNSAGDIVTNDHVVGTSTSFNVTTSAGKQLKGTLVGTFPEDDLAVIKVNGGGLTPATFADSSKLRVGDLAMAIGNPLGL